MEGGAVGYNFEKDPLKDHPCQAWFNSVQGFQRGRFKCESLRRTKNAKRWQKLNSIGKSLKRRQNRYPERPPNPAGSVQTYR